MEAQLALGGRANAVMEQEIRSYPRVLIVSAGAIGAPTGTGITLSNLFRDWPQERLAQVYTTSSEAKSEVFTRLRLLPPSAAPLDYAARRLMRRSLGGAGGTAPAIAAVGSAMRPEPVSAKVHRQMRAVADLSPLFLPKNLLNWVKSFKPHVIYTLLGSVRIMRLAYTISKASSVPIVPHFMDDWPTTLFESGELIGFARRAVHMELGRVLSRSARGLCISSLMAEEYSERFGLPFVNCANCIDEVDLRIRKALPPNGFRMGTTLTYVGGLHLKRAESIRQVAAAVESLNEQGLAIEFRVYAPEKDLNDNAQIFSSLSSSRLMYPLLSGQVGGVVGDSDILLHVESFDESVARYTRLSLSTKLPQYMAAGRPILGYGPGSLASMGHIRRSGGGIVVGRSDPVLLAGQLALLTNDTQLRRKLGNAGHEFARRHHRREAVVARLVDTLQASVVASNPDT
jgi:glycosyltransferase involved in cell wall biosynthesis